MKNLIRNFLALSVNVYVFFFLNFYRILNRNKVKMFIYTDSRGFEISKIQHRKSPFSSYLLYFVKNYNCDVYICPEKHTTIFDFLYTYKTKSNNIKYDYVIAHIGVVDFSPRVSSDISQILNLKKEKIINVFGNDFFERISNLEIFEDDYLGQKTSAIISWDNLLIDISDKFNEISNFIWISCNPVDVSWRGNYSRDRPININLVNDKSKKLIEKLNENVSVVNLTDLTIEEVHKYTCDNIHLSEDGMNFVKNKILKWVQLS
jgi:hypothetical protein